MCLHICFVPELLKSVTTYCYFLIHFTFRFDCFFRCTVKFSRQSPMCSERIAANVVAACRRRGYRKGSDESQKLLFRTAAETSCTPACGKLLVIGWHSVFLITIYLQFIYFNFSNFMSLPILSSSHKSQTSL